MTDSTETVDRRASLMLGRTIDPGELQASFIHCAPNLRVEAIEHVGAELDRPDISMRERARLLDLKASLNSVHQRMLRVYR